MGNMKNILLDDREQIKLLKTYFPSVFPQKQNRVELRWPNARWLTGGFIIERMKKICVPL